MIVMVQAAGCFRDTQAKLPVSFGGLAKDRWASYIKTKKQEVGKPLSKSQLLCFKLKKHNSQMKNKHIKPSPHPTPNQSKGTHSAKQVVIYSEPRSSSNVHVQK